MSGIMEDVEKFYNDMKEILMNIIDVYYGQDIIDIDNVMEKFEMYFE